MPSAADCRWTLTRVGCALACAVGSSQSRPASVDPVWEGALGLLVNHSPTYQGSADQKSSLIPGFFVRYGGFTATNSGGFVTRRDDDVERGLAAEILRQENLRVSLSARFDAGRDAGSDPALNGLPDVAATLRLRVSALRRLSEGWQLGLALSPDLLGRGGGTLVDASLRREWRLTPSVQANLGANITWANSRYARSYFGVTPAQSGVTGLAAFEPRSGLRNLGVSASLHADFGPSWFGFTGVNASHLTGDARRSPLTHRSNSWSSNSGLAWRF